MKLPESVAKAANATPVENAGEEYVRHQCVMKIVKVDDEEQIVTAEVYAPNVIDTWGDVMRDEDVRQMAYRFMQLVNMTKSIDTNHNNVPNGSYPIESFIAREGDTEYTPGAWVLSTKIVDSNVWADVKSGKLNGYSFEAMVRKLPAVAILEVTRDNLGVTEKANDHEHIFIAILNDDGVVVAGRTNTVKGHAHDILAGTATEVADNHKHRFFI